MAPFLLVAAFTGLLYAASFQAEKIVRGHEPTVPVGDRALPISEQVAAAREAHPEGTLFATRPSPEAGATTRMMLSGVPGGAPNHTLAVFADPYTGEVRGALEQYGSTGALPLHTWAAGAVTEVVQWADYPVLVKLSRRGVDLHTGSLFGLPDQIGLMLLAATLILLIPWGHRMWWQRGRGSAFGRPIPRGAWSRCRRTSSARCRR